MLTKVINEDVGNLSSSTSVEWKIQELFSLLSEVDYKFKSPCFHFLDATWYFQMNINGVSVAQSGGYVGLFLIRKHSKTEKHRIRYTFKMRTNDGMELSSFSQESDFDKCFQSWGNPVVVARSELVRSNTEFNPGGFVISCDLSDRSETTEPILQTESLKGVDKLAENFKQLFLSGAQSNFVLIVRDRKFNCHRGVLAARSSFFATMFKQNLAVVLMGSFKIDDYEPEAFEEFLIYLYSGSVKHFTKKNAFKLYWIAVMYEAPEVKARCVHWLTMSICVKNCCDIVDLALEHNDSELWQTAVTFFAKNTKRILVTQRWQTFLEEDPVEANKLLLKSVDENTSNALNTNEDKTFLNMIGVNSLGENFKELLLSEEESDIILNVQGRRFKCHRAVLAARSSVFAAMLKQDMLEKTTGIVEIDDCNPEAFQEFLTYLYSGSMDDFTNKNIFSLYRIADKYDVPNVKTRCVHLLTIDLGMKNFCDVVDLAHQYNELELLQTAVIFFAKNAKNILVTLSWQNFMKRNPIGANELYLKGLDIK